MRIFNGAYAQNIGWNFKRLWETQRNRQILDFGIRKKLENRGIQVSEVNKVLDLNLGFQRESVSHPSTSVNPPKSNPDWHEEPCRIYHDHTILLGGLNQSVNLTRTSLVSDKSLPSQLNSIKISVDENLHNRLQEAILHAHALDAVQEKLPKSVDVKRPGWNFPREYGLSKKRRNELLLSKMFHIMDTTLTQNGVDVFKNQTVMNTNLKEVLQASGEPMLFKIRANRILCSKKPLEPYSDSETRTKALSTPLPSIYPLEPTITIFPQNVYRLESLNPVKSGALYSHFNMAIFTLNMPFIKHQLSQLQARLLVHTFGTAACYAKQRFGKDVVDLPEPVVLNCVHTDSRNFIFGCLEVHSLNMNGPLEGRNLFWTTEPISLFEHCGYVDSKPVLHGYNPQVIETLLAMYHSQLSS